MTGNPFTILQERREVREVISRIPNEPILLLQNLKTFANDMAYLCVHALEPKVFQEKLGISLVMWLMFSKYPLMVKDAWDVDLTLKEDSDWLRHGGQRPKLSTRMYIVGSNIGAVNLLRLTSSSRNWRNGPLSIACWK